MRLKRTISDSREIKRSSGGFTLAEVLAALAFMAVVLPVAVEGLRVASRVGEVGNRKAIAARIGERVLNEVVAAAQWNKSGQSGTAIENSISYRWQIRNETWLQDPMKLLSVDVWFPVQGSEYVVRLSTLIDSTQQ